MGYTSWSVTIVRVDEIVCIKNKKAYWITVGFCDRGRVRTCNPQSRNLIFYPVELRSRVIYDIRCTIFDKQYKIYEIKTIIF